MRKITEADKVRKFWGHVDKSQDCWTMNKTWHNRWGYPIFRFGGKGRVRACRYVYELVKGPIPVGLHIDHLCHTNDKSCSGGSACPHRRCVNPAHLEAVTPRENLRRGLSPVGINMAKTHCLRGHLLSGDNLYLYHGERNCRACRAETQRKHNAKLKRERALKRVA